VISFVRVIKGFATGDPERLPDPNSYLADLSNPLRASRILIYGLQTLLGDTVLVSHATGTPVDGTKYFVLLQVWRCYIVYDRSLYVIIPSGIALLGNLGV
jgi:hypothetical protein